MKRVTQIPIVFWCHLLLSIALSAARGQQLDYGKDVQPLLAEHCYACHGPDEKTRKGGLRFDDRESATAMLESGHRAIVPGDGSASAMIRKIFSDDPDEVMPPPEFKKQPSDETRAMLKQWVAEGAVYTKHWAFEPIQKPVPPKVRNENWPRNAIDRFILARLEKEGLEPSPQASGETLVRRLSLDLRGLPPTSQEMSAYGDDASLEQAIDAMLVSLHYGERMAQDWLDLARYGDTNGYHNDSDRDMWLYRDYVIDSFNRNKPYDQFIVENMAGDLLPDATEETQVASGFHRCVTFNEEGGADPDEFYVTYAVDRANTTGQVFLGLTVGCAQCHDHKYDPISQKEFYQLYAFFNSVDGEIGAGGMSGYHGKPLPPLLKVQTAQSKARLAELEQQLKSREQALTKAREGKEFTDPDGPLGIAAVEWAAGLQAVPPDGLTITDGLQLHLDAAQADVETQSGNSTVTVWKDLSGKERHASATGAPQRVTDGLNGRAVIRLDGKNDFLRTKSGAEGLVGDFTMVAVLGFHELGRHQMALMWGDESGGKRRAFWKTDQDKLSFNGYSADVIGTGEFRKDEPAIAVITQHGGENLTQFFFNGRPSGEGKATLSAYENTTLTIGANNAGAEKSSAAIAEVLVYDRALNASEHSAIGRWLAMKFGIATEYQPAPSAIMAIASRSEEQRTPAERKQLFDYFIENVHSESSRLFRDLEVELAKLRQELVEIETHAPTTMVMVEMKERKPAYVLARGDFQQPGAQVQPDVPAIFPRLPDGKPRNRLGLAYWLIDPRHPLVARVTVNRLWKQLFGTGLVKTLGDLGTQGERPSHPQLLDWLAADFLEHGWDVKRLQRLMVESATYQQSSTVRSADAQVDPENRLLARAARFRLAAEEVRDTALAVSGLLNRTVGGKSVNPPQPLDYLSSIGKSWNESTGDARHRRGLYTFWRRTMLYPTFQIFDAPSREFCEVNRPRTNTPLQALVTLNDPAFVEAARALGRRIQTEGGATDYGRLSFAFRLATSRDPSIAELTVLGDALAEQRREFQRQPNEALQLLGGEVSESEQGEAGERAAWIALAGIVLNLDETITRE
jgi:hypothetical protein